MIRKLWFYILYYILRRVVHYLMLFAEKKILPELKTIQTRIRYNGRPNPDNA